MVVNSQKVWGLSAAHFMTDLYSPVIPAILPLLIINSGYTYLLAGLLVTAYNMTSSMTQPFIGLFLDRSGRGIPISSSLLMSAFFIALMGVTTNYVILFTCAILAGLGHATFHPSGLTSVGIECSDENRGRLMSYFVIGGNFGYAISPLLVGIAVGFLGLHGLILLFLPGCLMAIVVRHVLTIDIAISPYRDIPRAADRKGASLIRAVSILISASALRAWAIFAVISFLPTYLIHRHYSLVLANGLVTLMLVMGVVGQVFGGVLSDRYGRKEFTILGMLLSIPAFLIFLVTDGSVSIIAMLIFGFLLWSTFAITVAIAHELMPHSIGLASGLIMGLAVGGGGIGVAITGAIADAFTLDIALLTLPLPVASAILLFFILPYPWRLWKRAKSFEVD